MTAILWQKGRSFFIFVIFSIIVKRQKELNKKGKRYNIYMKGTTDRRLAFGFNHQLMTATLAGAVIFVTCYCITQGKASNAEAKDSY